MKLPADFKAEHLTALVDSREQLPYDLRPLQMKSATLDAADYSLLGCEHCVAIERKTLADFVACCGNERERFQRELLRLRGYAHRAVVIEASAADLEAGTWRSQINSKNVVASVLSWSFQLGIPFYLAGDRKTAEQWTAKLLFLAARHRWRECRDLAAGILEPEPEAKPARHTQNAANPETTDSFVLPRETEGAAV
jgi:DNA excision repair protein ERCC-4